MVSYRVAVVPEEKPWGDKWYVLVFLTRSGPFLSVSPNQQRQGTEWNSMLWVPFRRCWLGEQSQANHPLDSFSRDLLPAYRHNGSMLQLYPLKQLINQNESTQRHALQTNER